MLDELMATHEDVDPFEMITDSPLLILAVCAIMVLAITGLQVVLR